MQHEDDDWLFPAAEEPSTPSLRMTVALEKDPGVYRFDAVGDNAMPFVTLQHATCEPPMDIDARVVDANDRALALADQERAAWVLTRYGRDWNDREISGRPNKASSDDREEFAEEWAAEDRMEREREGEVGRWW